MISTLSDLEGLERVDPGGEDGPDSLVEPVHINRVQVSVLNEKANLYPVILLQKGIFLGYNNGKMLLIIGSGLTSEKKNNPDPDSIPEKTGSGSYLIFTY